MKVENTQLKGVKKIILDSFVDHRGKYVEIYNYNFFDKNGIAITFCQDDISVSNKGVFRGIHGDNETWKLVSCLKGQFYLVVVTCDKDNAHYGLSQGFMMSEHINYQVLIPPKYGNGHLALSDNCIFHYKQSTYYAGEAAQFSYNVKDPFFDIRLPVDKEDLILSKRDTEAKFVK